MNEKQPSRCGPWYQDTDDPRALDVLADLYRNMTPGERLAKVFEMVQANENLQRASVRAMYPEADDREVFLRVASRRLDRDLMIKAYGWDPALHP